MTAKECLSQLTNMRLRIEALENAIVKCYSNAAKTTPGYGDGFVGGTSDNKIESNVERVVEYEAELTNLINTLEQFQYDLTMEINRIPNNIYVALLINKYICDDPWEVVAVKLDKTCDYTQKELHSKALAEFERVVMADPRKPLEIPLYSAPNV